MVPYQPLAALSDHWSSAVIEEMACDVSLWFYKRMLAGPALKTTDDNLYLGSERLCRAFFPDFIFPREWIHATEIKSLWRLILFSYRPFFLLQRDFNVVSRGWGNLIASETDYLAFWVNQHQPMPVLIRPINEKCLWTYLHAALSVWLLLLLHVSFGKLVKKLIIQCYNSTVSTSSVTIISSKC